MLEVIAISIEDIKLINKSNADQIEFCVDIFHGGLSPSIELVDAASKISQKKLMIMLRMHYETFVINDQQLKELILFVKQTRKLNFKGFVFGAITNHGDIDEKALLAIEKELENKILTFHKAIDVANDKCRSIINILKHESIHFILTSGGIGLPEKNTDILLKIPMDRRRQILLGGGVTMKSINKFKIHGFLNYHIGRAARIGNSYKSSISIENINMYKKKIGEFNE